MPILQESLQNAGATENPVVNAMTPPGQPEPVGKDTSGQLPAPNPAITCPAVKAHMPQVDQMAQIMDPKQRAAFERVVLAGKKVLYSKQSADMVQGLIMDKDIPVKNKLGEGVANLLIMMDNQANGSIPKDIVIPAGVVIMFEAADYMFECGFDISEKDLGDALEILVYGVFDGFGIPRDKVDAVLDDMADKMGFEEGDAGKVTDAAEEAQEAGTLREPIPGDNPQEEAAEGPAGDSPEEEAFEQGFRKTRGM